MKKTKLFTSLVALALVLSLGACGETEDDTTTDESSGITETGTSGTTTEESGSGGTTSSGDTTENDGEEDNENDYQKLLTRIDENLNYEMEIQYQRYAGTTTYDEIPDSFYGVYTRDLYETARLYVTNEAILILYGETTDFDWSGEPWEWGYGFDCDDIDLYLTVETESGDMSTEIYRLNEGSDDVYDLYLAETLSGTWEDNLESLKNLVEYKDSFVCTSEGVAESRFDIIDEDGLREFFRVCVGAGTKIDDEYGYSENLSPSDIYNGKMISQVHYDEYEITISDWGKWYQQEDDKYVNNMLRVDTSISDIGGADLSNYIETVQNNQTEQEDKPAGIYDFSLIDGAYEAGSSLNGTAIGSILTQCWCAGTTEQSPLTRDSSLNIYYGGGETDTGTLQDSTDCILLGKTSSSSAGSLTLSSSINITKVEIVACTLGTGGNNPCLYVNDGSVSLTQAASELTDVSEVNTYTIDFSGTNELVLMTNGGRTNCVLVFSITIYSD